MTKEEADLVEVGDILVVKLDWPDYYNIKAGDKIVVTQLTTNKRGDRTFCYEGGKQTPDEAFHYYFLEVDSNEIEDKLKELFG